MSFLYDKLYFLYVLKGYTWPISMHIIDIYIKYAKNRKIKAVI